MSGSNGSKPIGAGSDKSGESAEFCSNCQTIHKPSAGCTAKEEPGN